MSTINKAAESFVRAQATSPQEVDATQATTTPALPSVIIDPAYQAEVEKAVRKNSEAHKAAKPGAGGARLGQLSMPTAAEQRAYKTLNQEMATKFPSLAIVFADPDRFVASAKQRFEAQKAKTPNDPYAFDFSDYGAPVLKDMAQALTQEIADKGDPTGYLAELKQAVSTDKVTYRRLQEFGHYVSRALGHGDMSDIKARDRVLINLDRLQLGFEKVDLKVDQARFRAGEFKTFAKHSPVGTLLAVEQKYVDDMFDKNEMKMVCLPTMSELDTTPFMRLTDHPIYFMGVTRTPLPADGYVRPGGDFWNHDQRHSASLYTKKAMYEEAHGLGPTEINKLQKMGDRWRLEMREEMAKIPDENLRKAIDFFMFNHHHDRGIRFLPSSFAPDQKPGSVAMGLYVMLKLSNQPVDFVQPKASMAKAWTWLQEFWAPRLKEEKALWRA